MKNDLVIVDTPLPPGEKARIQLPIGSLPTHTAIHMEVLVARGQEPGPKVFLSSSIHGDEICGIEVVRRVWEHLEPAKMRGTVICVPIVNVYGFIQQSRYLPDRRDMNRFFPGTKRGSLASRVANLFMQEIVKKCDHGIDLHSAAVGRYNLPHIRGDFEHEGVRELAEAFATRVIFHSPGRDGTLRRAANKIRIPVIVFEAGEAGRFDSVSIEEGYAGSLRVLAHLNVLEQAPAPAVEPMVAQGSAWVRARRAGILRLRAKSGELVRKNQLVGTIGDVLGEEKTRVLSPCNGLIISHATQPLLNQGDAVVNIAKLD